MRLLTGPLANVTPTGPLPAPAGTTAEIWVVDRLLKVVAGTPPNVTPVTPTRPVPSIITVMPGAPPAGVTPVMSAGGKMGHDDDRVAGREGGRVVTIAQHAPGFRHVEMPTPEGQAVRTIELADHRRARERGHDAPFGEGNQQGPCRVNDQGSWRAETSGEDFDANPGWHRKVR